MQRQQQLRQMQQPRQMQRQQQVLEQQQMLELQLQQELELLVFQQVFRHKQSKPKPTEQQRVQIVSFYFLSKV
jgi:hypothetical protein